MIEIEISDSLTAIIAALRAKEPNIATSTDHTYAHIIVRDRPFGDICRRVGLSLSLDARINGEYSHHFDDDTIFGAIAQASAWVDRYVAEGDKLNAILGMNADGSIAAESSS